MGSGQWPGHMVRQEGSGNLAYKRDVHMGHTALWELEGCIKVGHVDAHQNSFPGLEGEWNHRQISPCALLRQPPASKKLSGYGVSAAMWDWLTLDTLFLYTLMHKMPVRTVLSASKKKAETAHGCVADSQLWRPWTYLASYRVALGDFADSGPGFSYPVVEASAQSVVREPEQKTGHQFGWLSSISSE